MRASPSTFCSLVVAAALLGALGCHSAPYVELYPYRAGVKIKLEQPRTVAARVATVPVFHDKRVERLIEMFEEVGCTGEHLEIEYVNGSRDPNVRCTLPGSSGKRIIVASHHVIATGGAGVFDAWTSVALLPGLYASVKSADRHHTYEFIGFTATDNFGDASYLYLRDDEEWRESITAMVWLDYLGLGDVRAWGTRTDPNLWADLQSVGKALDVDVIVSNLNGSGGIHDHSRAFRWYDIPTAYIHSLDQKSQRMLRRRLLDTDPSKIDMRAYLRSYRLLAVYLGYLDHTLVARNL